MSGVLELIPVKPVQLSVCLMMKICGNVNNALIQLFVPHGCPHCIYN